MARADCRELAQRFHDGMAAERHKQRNVTLPCNAMAMIQFTRRVGLKNRGIEYRI
jgi:hypothetical protein